MLVTQNGIQHPFLVDTGARSNLISLAWWKAIGKPPIQDITAKYRSATRHPIPILGTVRVDSSLLAGENMQCKELEFPVTKVDVNIIGLDTVLESNIKLVSLLRKPYERSLVCTVLDSKSLQEACQQLPREFPGLWTNELGCLKDFQRDSPFVWSILSSSHKWCSGEARSDIEEFSKKLKEALQQFLMQYRRSPSASGFLQASCSITGTFAMLPSPVHINQERLAQEATKSLPEELISTGHCE